REYLGPAALNDAAAPRCFELLWCQDVPSCYGNHVNMPQPTVCRIAERVSRLLARTIFTRSVKFPHGAQSLI
ncbi:hypothetical protein HPB47_002048, partial [Ixodes persulcatus]